MPAHPSPEAVVQRQLEAFNARDLDAWVETYAEDARQFEFPAKLLATGRAEIRARMAARFQEPDLNARLVGRAVMGDIVVDHEHVVRSFPDGRGHGELVAVYEVREGRIRTASFVFGARVAGADR